MGIQAQAIAATFNVTDVAGLRSALLTAATNGEDDVIVLAAGTYATGDTTFAFVTNETNTLTLQGAVGTTRSQVVLDGGGTSQVLNFGCAGSCGAITLQGLTVQNGNATGSGSGGGVSTSTNLTVSDVSSSGNRAGGSGGAIRVSGSLTVDNSSFDNNTATGNGGAISSGSASRSAAITRSSFNNNTAHTGGAISAGLATVTNSSFNNNAAQNGGAVYGTVTVTSASFRNNAATNIGGAIFAFVVAPVTNSLFSHNTAGLRGGAIHGWVISVNNTFYANASAGLGAAIYFDGVGPIINSVFYSHTTPAIYAQSAYNLYNNLIDTNTGIAGSSPIMVGNIATGATSPFVDEANGNFRLATESIAIDAGLDPNSTTFANLVGSSNVAAIRAALLTDLDGNPRPKPGTAVDIGAYESGTTVTNPNTPVCTLTASPTSIATGGTSNLMASCNPAATSYLWSANAGLGSTVTTGTVSPTVTTTYTVAGSNGSGTGNTASATVTVTLSTASLTVTAAGSGAGTVASSPAGISCGATCSASFTGGTKVTLTATPSNGSTFAGWKDACTGTGTCTVTIEAAKHVTAIFKVAPFDATTAAIVTATSATIATRITFNPSDVGKPGAVYVTEWVPVQALGTLGISVTSISRQSITSTPDNSSVTGAANNLQVTNETLAAADPNAFVLVQLTRSGWQLVVNEQLIPYASGVFGPSLATQTILNNADPTNLFGAQFCVGYGTTAQDMITAGNIQLVAVLPDPNAASAVTGTCLLTNLPVYRFFNMNAGGHFYTLDAAERDTVIQNYKWFRDEGVGFYAYLVEQPDTLPVYRFFHNNAGGHFYTISEEEKNTVLQNYKWFRFEGLGFYAYPVQQPGTLPVYRFFNTNAGGHFYTIDAAERDTVIQNYKWFRYEGIGFYAYPSP